jgi:hypothetical protein
MLSWRRRLDHAEKANVDISARVGGAAPIRDVTVDGDEGLRARLRKTYEPVHIEVERPMTRWR